MQYSYLIIPSTLLLLSGVVVTYLLHSRYRIKIMVPDRVGPLPRPAERISVIVPARNEEAALPACLESLLRLEYPDYEIILVDDDSTDSTGRIGDDYARRPESAARLKVIHNHEVAPGWSGKVHALSLAERAATGDWLLATDADVVFHASLLRQAVELDRDRRDLVAEHEVALLVDDLGVDVAARVGRHALVVEVEPGLADRVDALGGPLELEGPPGAGPRPSNPPSHHRPFRNPMAWAHHRPRSPRPPMPGVGVTKKMAAAT